MKRFALPSALCAMALCSFTGEDDAEQVTLNQATTIILSGGAETTSTGGGDVELGGGGSATNYCQASVNSTAQAASITYYGSLALEDGSFGLSASGVPPNPASWGMFTYGGVQTNTPFGNGFLCISPFNPGIFKMPTQSLGNGTVTIDMESHPAAFDAFTAGSTWNFQFWFRDVPAGGANFNLSNGLKVVFSN